MKDKNEDNKEINEIEVVKPKVVKAKKFLIKADVGTNPDGSVKYPKGSMQALTKKQQDNYKLNNII